DRAREGRAAHSPVALRLARGDGIPDGVPVPLLLRRALERGSIEHDPRPLLLRLTLLHALAGGDERGIDGERSLWRRTRLSAAAGPGQAGRAADSGRGC